MISEPYYRHVKILVGEKKREVTVYTPEALQRQRALLKVNRQHLKCCTHAAAYGYAEGKSTWTAAQAILRNYRSFSSFLVCDIKSFFDTIDRNLLRQLLNGNTKLQNSEEMLQYVFCSRKGIAQGSPLSPVLSNYFLYEMDSALSKLSKSFYLRYADDLIFLTDTPERDMATLRRWTDVLRLQISEKKTLSGQIMQGFEFIGFEFSKTGLLISKKKQQEMNMRMHLAPEEERKRVFQGYQAYYRSTSFLRPDVETLQWVLQYASLVQAANYVRRFSNAEWNLALPMLETMNRTWKSVASTTMGAKMGRNSHKKSVRIAG